MPTEVMPKEAPTQIETDKTKPSRRIWTPVTAEFGVKVIKQHGKEGLYRVRSLESSADSHLVDLNAKTCTCPDFTQGLKCRHIEIVENIGEIRRQKWREQHRMYYRTHSQDSEFKRRASEAMRKMNLKLREAYRRLKIEYGGKCVVCGESDLDVLEPHHPNGKKEKVRGFINSKEFRDWVRHRTKPNIVLVCANHHRKLHIMEARGEGDYYKI